MIREYLRAIEFYLIWAKIYRASGSSYVSGRLLFSTRVAIFRAFYHAVFRRQVKERYRGVYESNGVRSLSRTDSAGLFMADHFLDKSVIFLETGCSSWRSQERWPNEFSTGCNLLLSPPPSIHAPGTDNVLWHEFMDT